MTEHLNIPDEETLPNREVRGISWKQAGWVLFTVVTLEASILGGIFHINNSIENLTTGKALLEQRLQGAEIKIERLETRSTNLESRMQTAEYQLSDTYTERAQKKYDTNH